MSFEFVNNNAIIDCAARRRIRSHVAMGRNAGKILTRPSRKKLGVRITSTTALTHFPNVINTKRDSGSIEDVVYEIERQVGDGLSVLRIPKQLNPASVVLVKKVFSFIGDSQYTPELSIAFDASGLHTSMWVQFMFLDEAYFHCVMAMSVTVLNSLLTTQEDTTQAICHLSQTFRLVNEKLSRDDAISDTTLAVVVVMAQYARLQVQYRQGLVHLEGLVQMIELRGGVSQLTRNQPGLAQMIFKTDLEYALHQGSATRFNVADIVASNSAMLELLDNLRKRCRTRRLPALDYRLLAQLNADLQSLLIDISDLAWLINDASAKDRPQLRGFPFHDYLLLLGYHLIRINPLGGPRPISHVENVIHLGLMAFIIIFLRGFDRQIPTFPILSELTRLAAQEDFGSEQESQEMMLWMLFIGEASIFRKLDDAWLFPMANQAMHNLELYTWEDVARTLTKFPWVNVIHDKAGQELWYKSTSHYMPLSEATSKRFHGTIDIFT